MTVWKLFGSYHPLLVHFPVALIIAASVAETLLIIKRNPDYGAAARFCVAAAAWVSIPAALAGFAIASSHSFEGAAATYFSIHRIAGITTPVLAFLAWAMGEGSRRSGQVWEQWLYRVFLLVALISVIVAGLAGGELAHGIEGA